MQAKSEASLLLILQINPPSVRNSIYVKKEREAKVREHGES
jgi:hypothetical protein